MDEQIAPRLSMDWAKTNAVSRWWIEGQRNRKAKVAGSIPAGGSINYERESNSFDANHNSPYSPRIAILFIGRRH